ncbi:MAG: HAMP domain-containing histidine kinase [Cyanobacterium sp. T60_A2020_053]|nr:HAMP domain-containing histidine kinase [Cyanobacterium sp. T60_A2020_053]
MIVSDPLATKLSNLLMSENVIPQKGIPSEVAQIKAQQEWESAIASLQELLLSVIKPSEQCTETQGFVLSSPHHVISKKELISALEIAVFSPLNFKNSMTTYHCQESSINGNKLSSALTLTPEQHIAKDQFCLILTQYFSCLLVKNSNNNFNFSFEPNIINQAWLLVQNKLVIKNHYSQKHLDSLYNQLTPSAPPYQLVSRFTNYLLQHLRALSLPVEKSIEKEEKPHRLQSISLKKTPLPPYPEIELLQALTHEVRTPLTSIKTITKLLQKKAKASPELAKYLEMIDQECTEQINRMDLIFRVAELESNTSIKPTINLVPICLEEILNQGIPIWQKQAQRRNILLNFVIPQKLPHVLSDPAILKQMLGGLIEKFTRNIPSGGKFQVIVLPAGNQLKLQFLSESNLNHQQVKCLGKLLSFQPETGGLYLNSDITKHIFNVLGGKLTIKQKGSKGEILTVFLPLGNPII